MERAARISDKPDHLHRASQLWLHTENLEKAPPLHQQLTSRPEPEDAWLATLSSAHRMLDDVLSAGGAMEAPAGLDPSNGDLTEKLIRLYRAAGGAAESVRQPRFDRRAMARPSFKQPLANIVADEVDHEMPLKGGPEHVEFFRRVSINATIRRNPP